jgi:hypothetical protein
MKRALAGLAIVAAVLTVRPAAAAYLSDADAGRLAETAFTSTGNAQHGEMDGSLAKHYDRNFAWFRTDFAATETIEGFAIFAVDLRTGAVWAVGDTHCVLVETPELAALRTALHLSHPALPPPPARYCHL